jgi:probable phosphoglycerate mutase
LKKIVGSWTDFELTDAGKAQAEAIGKKLSEELSGKPCKIYCSDLLRAKQTAAPLTSYLGAEAEYRSELREQNLGVANGRPWAWADEHKLPVRNVGDPLFPGAESLKDVWNRLKPFCDEIIASDFETVVIVSHSFCLSVWFSVWLQWDMALIGRSRLLGLPGGVSFMDETADGKRTITRLNDMSYLK